MTRGNYVDGLSSQYIDILVDNKPLYGFFANRFNLVDSEHALVDLKEL